MDNLKEKQSKIGSVDLSRVQHRLIEKQDWTKSQAEKAIEQYRRYLYLAVKYSGQALPPSLDIDEVWHAHILHTKDYTKFCEEIFGRFLHHEPEPIANEQSTSNQNMTNQFEITQELYKKEFGDYIYRVREGSFFAILLGKLSKIFGVFKRRSAPVVFN